MRILALLSCLLVAGCSHFGPHAATPSPSGTLFASIRLTRDAFTGESVRRTGFFFYVEMLDRRSPTLTGYRYHHGELVQPAVSGAFGGASGSTSVVAALRAVNLQPFDFEAELKRCETSLRAEAQAQGKQFFVPGVLDGAEYEIVIMTNKGPMTLRSWNPSYSIDFYAAHSRKIAKLKAILDILALYYGRLQFEA